MYVIIPWSFKMNQIVFSFYWQLTAHAPHAWTLFMSPARRFICASSEEDFLNLWHYAYVKLRTNYGNNNTK